MKTSRRVFVAAWAYPPLMSGESVVCQRALRHSKFQYDLCCGPFNAEEDSHVRAYPIAGEKYICWPLLVAKKFRELDSKNRYSVFMSRVMPPNGHFAGWLIKRLRPKIKWIAYYSDPVWNSPFLKFSLKKDDSHRPNYFLMKIMGVSCRWALKDADVLVFNNERLAHYVLGNQFKRFSEKVVIVPYGHEGVSSVRHHYSEKGAEIQIAHIGQIYGNRTFAELINGLSILKTQNIQAYNAIRIQQIGFVCDAELERVKNSDVRDKFSFSPPVSYEKSIEAMKNADCLLAIDPCFDTDDKNVYIPGKLFDYMSTGQPILCVAAENSATGDAAKMFGCLRVSPSGEQIAAVLETLSDELIAFDNTNYAKASCKLGAERFDAVLEALMNDDSYSKIK